jgi:hypothetical protein
MDLREFLSCTFADQTNSLINTRTVQLCPQLIPCGQFEVNGA